MKRETPRNLVRQTLEFDSPRRIPRQIWILPWAELRYPDIARDLRARFPDDIAIAQCEFGPGAKPENVYEVFETWNRLDDGRKIR